ncbi:MAG: hypothetical protein DME82_07280, partial [Verrucomicrobia bacterium]
RPCWTSYSVCDVEEKDCVEKQLPGPTWDSANHKWIQAPSINVDTKAKPMPRRIILKDAAGQVYKFNVKMPVPWRRWATVCPPATPPPASVDPDVAEPVSALGPNGQPLP